MSPLHAALIASVVANGGILVPPALVEAAEGVAAPVPAAPLRVVDERVADALGEMMRTTVTDGTARRAFRRGAGPLRGVAVAGKTGSLADRLALPRLLLVRRGTRRWTGRGSRSPRWW